MKTTKRILFMVMMGMLSLVLVAGCGQVTQPTQSRQEAPSTPLNVETPLSSQPPATPTPTQTAAATSTPTSVPENALTIGLWPGSWLTNESRNRLYYITAEGTARRIESWMTFYAFGFQREAVLTVDDATLDQLPSSGHLTRHLYDDLDYRYWAVQGTLWAIDAWQPTLTAATFRGVPPTPVDSLLLASMPVVTAIPDGILMRDGVKMYVKQGGSVYPVASSSVYYQAFGYTFNQAIEIPHGVMAEYDDKQPLSRFLRSEGEIFEIADGQRQAVTLGKLIDAGYSEDDVQTVTDSFLQAFPLVTVSVSLRVGSSVVNLRQGPGTGYSVVDQVSANEELMAVGRTPDDSWFKVRYQGETAWVAASVVDLIGDLESLPQIDAQIVYAVPTPTPAPAPTPEPLKPVVCREVPIRGFGKVWADHIWVQHHLRCPSHAELATGAAVQQFQHGTMIWVEQDSVRGNDPVYVLFDDGTYQRFGNVRPPDPAAVGSTPPGFHPLGDKFSAIYWEGTGARVKERLGHATTPQMDSPGAFQQFYNGRMFWLGTIDRIFVVHDYPPGWAGFEDTF